MPENKPQAIVHIVKSGGARTVKRLCAQWDYLTREGNVDLVRSERHGGSVIPHDELDHWALSWLEQTGNYCQGQRTADSNQELTTHIIVSFPPRTDQKDAEKAGRAWAEEVFGFDRFGDARYDYVTWSHPVTYDYVTAMHTDRPHPHLHVIVNRRAFEQSDWLAISHRNEEFNYDFFRERLAHVSKKFNIELDSSSREQRGLPERHVTNEQYRQWKRDSLDAIEIKEEYDSGYESELIEARRVQAPQRGAAGGASEPEFGSPQSGTTGASSAVSAPVKTTRVNPSDEHNLALAAFDEAAAGTSEQDDDTVNGAGHKRRRDTDYSETQPPHKRLRHNASSTPDISVIDNISQVGAGRKKSPAKRSHDALDVEGQSPNKRQRRQKDKWDLEITSAPAAIPLKLRDTEARQQRHVIEYALDSNAKQRETKGQRIRRKAAQRRENAQRIPTQEHIPLEAQPTTHANWSWEMRNTADRRARTAKAQEADAEISKDNQVSKDDRGKMQQRAAKRNHSR